MNAISLLKRDCSPVRPNFRWLVAQAIFLFLAACWLYWPTGSYDFTLDDPLVTILNKDVACLRPDCLGFFQTALYHGTQANQEYGNLYRPIPKLSFAVQYLASGGQFNPSHLHLANVVLFALTVLGVFFFYRAIFPELLSLSPFKERVDSLFPFLAACLFLVFPSHTESVCNIKHREELLACLFGILAWLCVLRHRGKGGIGVFSLLGALFLFLAELSKESAILLLPCILLLEILQNRLKSIRQLFKTPYAFYLLAAGLYAVLRVAALGAPFNPAGTRSFFEPTDGFLAHAGVSAWVFCRYYLIDQFFTLQLDPAFSSRLVLFQGGQPNAGSMGSLLLLGALLGALIVLLLGRRNPLAVWGSFFFISSALTFNLIPTGTAGAFRLMFTPSVFLCAFPVLLFVVAGRKTGPKLIAQALLVLLCAFYAFRTREQMEIWKNDGTLFRYSASLAPGNALSDVAAGQYFERVGALDPKFTSYRHALSIFLQHADHEELYDERTTDAFSVVATECAFNLVNQDPAAALPLTKAAIHQFERLQTMRAGRIDSNITAPYYVRALALMKLGRNTEAAEVCRAGLAVSEHPGLRQLERSLLQGSLTP